MIGFIGTDLDGTLLDDDQKISEVNVRAIRLATASGIQYGICSGRTLNSVKKYFDEVLKVPGYKVLLNGAVVFDENDVKIIDRPLPTSTVEQLLRQVDGFGFKVVLDSLDTTYVNDPLLSGSTYYEGVSKQNIVVSSVEELRRINDQEETIIYKVCFSSSEEQLNILMEKIETFTSMPVVISRSGKSYYELNALDCTKLSALQRISGLASIPISNFMCFGDYGNDLEMLKGVGYGVAMENAMSEVKENADFITKTNLENGVAWTINQVLEQKIK